MGRACRAARHVVSCRRMVEPTPIVLLAMGGPERMDAVEPFLKNLFSDPLLFPLPGARLLAPLIARRRAPEAKKYYARIGGGSPLNATTERQARALEAALGEGFAARAAFRYWGPGEAEAVRWAAGLGARRVVALPMYAQYCRATTLSSLHELRRAAGAAGVQILEIADYHDDAAYLDALAAPVRAMLAEFGAAARPHVVMSAHGVPKSFVKKGDPYVAQVETTARLLAARLPPGTAWTLSYQSRVGPVRWVRPYTDEVLARLGREGVREVLMVPLSFVADHVETLDEMDIRLRGMALDAGIADFRRVPALNDDPAFIAALCGIVRRRIA
jgi:protoporphyrin/coproporphyrin ferrochelatase